MEEVKNSIICFHNPDEENGYLSNWFRSDFIIDGIKFSSAEQYMMYQKALVFDDFDTAGKILKTDDVREIKSLGRQVKNYDENTWSGLRQVVVYNGLLEKFRQNEDLAYKLLNTNGTFAECAVKDTIWGIGLSMTDENRFDKSKWKGQNLLGYSLVCVRKQIAVEYLATTGFKG